MVCQRLLLQSVGVKKFIGAKWSPELLSSAVKGMFLLKSKQKQIQSGALYKYIVDLWLYDILYNQKMVQ